MKYDSQIGELKNLLPNTKGILIVLPSGANIDKLAAGLALFLTLESQGKEVSIASDDAMLVGHTHLFGVDHVQKVLPSTGGGNLTLTLEGVAASDNTVPALEKLDWFAENNNLNLVFHVLPNQTFQPIRIVPKYQGSGFNVIFVVGATNLNALGTVYSMNTQAFSGTHIVNIDNQTANTSFGQTNVLDTGSSSLGEMMTNLILDLGYALDADSASNLLAGVFDSTGNLSAPNVTAETYMAVANCLRVGGRKPSVQTIQSAPQTQPVTPSYDWSALVPKDQPIPQVQSIPEFMVPPVVSSPSTNQPVNNSGDDSQQTTQLPQPSPEELPVGEAVVSETVEPEWLTPKIFKGSSLG